MGRLERCKSCSAELVDGPEVERSGASERFECHVGGIPTKVCPRGCTGSYWYWLDFGVEVMELLHDADCISRRKWRPFKTRHLCKSCNLELEDQGLRENFILRETLLKGTELETRVSAPALTCTICGKNFMPAQNTQLDPYYEELGDLLSETVSRDLHRE